MGYQQPGSNQPPPGYDQYGQYGRQAGYNPHGVANTSGQGEAAVIPPEIQGWNWGAFWLSWIWGIGNNVMIALLAFIVPFWNIYLGLKGNELAWRNKQWESVEHFKQVQKKWAVWGLGLFIATMALTCVCVGIWFLGTVLAVGYS